MNYLSLPPQVLFVLSASQHNFATVWLVFFNFFFLYILKKNSTLSNISAAEAGTFRNSVYRAHCATGLKPSPTNAHTHSTCTAP